MLEMEALQGETALPTKAFVQLGPDMALPFAPFGCTHPSPYVSHRTTSAKLKVS